MVIPLKINTFKYMINTKLHRDLSLLLFYDDANYF